MVLRPLTNAFNCFNTSVERRICTKNTTFKVVLHISNVQEWAFHYQNAFHSTIESVFKTH
jgi:hypothetical protein